ncbi:MAG: hypothetical protein IPP61_10480 [Cytophagaceae bacterium]|nr:hypothetical protein [Cytophagaceae bacterium]MBK9933519.1 hypothetical protein [Cytophagaceae bacterium]MBL0302767.1 hypothetical protein [Cytophagaceae bacterium]MBL0325588.1 hypothetical protein [Cytophagaceae bacterium]
MKKRKGLFKILVGAFVATVIVVTASAQTPCSTGLHEVFGEKSTDAPVLLERLGTSPQFGEIPKHTADAAYTHLKKVHTKNIKGSKVEIDNFLKALGYTGFKDPLFSSSKIEPALLPAGKTGWMGAYSKGHKYKWSVLGRDFETFKIISSDGSCHAYIMKKCGNAFYDPGERCIPCTPCDPNVNDKTKCPPAVVCATQTINFSGKGKIQAGDVINTTKNIPVVATYNGKNLCVGDYQVPVRLAYDMNASGEVNYAKTIKVCDYGQGVPANASINVPVNLLYIVASSDVAVGENGKMIMAVSAKQFKTLKKVYKACPAGETASSAATASNKVNTKSEGSPETVSGGGDGKNCVKQTLTLNGSAVTEDISSKVGTNEVTMIGVYKKTGKLQKGETANKYKCLGTYSVPAKSSLNYSLKGNSSLSHIIEVCDDGNVKPVEEISVPMSMTNNFTKQDVTVGDYGRIYVPLSKSEYKKLGKSFSRCCSDGSSKSKCF